MMDAVEAAEAQASARIVMDMVQCQAANEAPPRDHLPFHDSGGVEDSSDPVQAHMQALRRQLSGNFRELTSSSEDVRLETYVDDDQTADNDGKDSEQASCGISGGTKVEMYGSSTANKGTLGRMDPREFWARVTEYQHLRSEGEAVGCRRAEDLLKAVPPVTGRDAANMSELFEQGRAEREAAGFPAHASPDDAASKTLINPDPSSSAQWLEDAPNLSAVQQHVQSGEADEDEELALLRGLQTLSMESPVIDEAITSVVETAQHKYQDILDSKSAAGGDLESDGEARNLQQSRHEFASELQQRSAEVNLAVAEGAAKMTSNILVDLADTHDELLVPPEMSVNQAHYEKRAAGTLSSPDAKLDEVLEEQSETGRYPQQQSTLVDGSEVPMDCDVGIS